VWSARAVAARGSWSAGAGAGCAGSRRPEQSEQDGRCAGASRGKTARASLEHGLAARARVGAAWAAPVRGAREAWSRRWRAARLRRAGAGAGAALVRERHAEPGNGV
jgi:hypothetical protein